MFLDHECARAHVINILRGIYHCSHYFIAERRLMSLSVVCSTSVDFAYFTPRLSALRYFVQPKYTNFPSWEFYSEKWLHIYIYIRGRKILLAAQVFEVWIIDDINAFLLPRLSKIPRVTRSLYAVRNPGCIKFHLVATHLHRYWSNLSEISFKFSKTFLRSWAAHKGSKFTRTRGERAA